MAWELTLVLGLVEIVWILIEVVLCYDLGFFIFYPFVPGMGVATLLLSIEPSVRGFFSSKESSVRPPTMTR